MAQGKNLDLKCRSASKAVSQRQHQGMKDRWRGSLSASAHKFNCLSKNGVFGTDRTAAVYRGPNGAVQAFLCGSERHGQPTTYTFHCTDRDVFYDGNGPQRDYTVTIAGNQERVINITWGADVQPAISARYAIVNGNRGLVIEWRMPGSTTMRFSSKTFTAAQAISFGMFIRVSPR